MHPRRGLKLTRPVQECGSAGYTDPWAKQAPSRYLERAERTFKVNAVNDKDYVYLTPAVLPMPDLGTRHFLASLINSATPAAFDNEAMGLVVRVMWNDFIRQYFLVDLSLFFTFFLLWTVLVDMTSSTTASSSDSRGGFLGTESIVGVTVCVLNTGFAIKETIQAKFFKSRAYYTSVWNTVDILSIFLVYGYVGSTSWRGGPGSGNVPLAVLTTLLLTVKLLSYMRGFDSTGENAAVPCCSKGIFSNTVSGWLISVLIQNFRDVRGFSFVLAAILFGFTISFRLLLGRVSGECMIALDNNGQIEEDCRVDPFRTIGRSMLSTFELTILGTYDPGVFDESQHTLLSIMTFVLAVTCVLVVALNALIAVLSDSYARVQENSVGNRRKERAELIVEYLSVIPRFRRERIEKQTQFFHALLEADEDGDLLVNKDDWQGGLAALRKDLEDQTERETEVVRRGLEELRAELDNELSSFRREITTALHDLSADLKHLKQLQSEGGVTINGRNVARGVKVVKSIGRKVLVWRGRDS